MKVFFDTEFEDKGNSIELISIGLITENDEKVFYAENCNYDYDNADSWLKENVIPKLYGGSYRKSRNHIKETLQQITKEFDRVEFYAYYCAYDWVCMCQLFGGMLRLPSNWSQYCRDVKWLADSLGAKGKQIQKPVNAHNALDDAIWLRKEYQALMMLKDIQDVRRV